MNETTPSRLKALSSALRHFLASHPAVRDALLWAIPAIIVGGLVRVLLISYLPYAFWGADSRSYFSFAHLLIVKHVVSLDEKRRYLYPLFMLPLSLLPGSPLRWIALAQHTLGVISLVPLAYIVRKTMAYWRLWIVPVTVLYSVLPIIVWQEHELLGETLFFAALLWAYAGWVAWVSETKRARALRLFWCFFVPFAIFLLTKPSGRFTVPGVLLGMVIIAAWKRLDWRNVMALVALGLVGLTVGSKKQGAWIMYTASFPLTQLDTPRHADYKAQIRDLVEPLAGNLDTYYLADSGPFEFLEHPDEHGPRPLWKELRNDDRKRTQLYMDLATEGIKAHPGLFLYFGIQRLVPSANLSWFHVDRFTGDYYRSRTEHFYAEAERNDTSPVRFAYGLPAKRPLPPYSEFQRRLEPTPDTWRARVVQALMGTVGESLDFSSIPPLPRSERKITLARPTLLGWWLFAAVAISLTPFYLRTHGVWLLIAAGYLLAMFMVSLANPRYFAPAWPIIIPLLALPADALTRMIARFQRRADATERPATSAPPPAAHTTPATPPAAPAYPPAPA